MKPEYATSDLYLAAFLKAQGLRVGRVEREGRKATFVFEDRDGRQDLVREFYNDGTVAVNAFTHALQDLKGVVYNW
jgi:hypothetical protein